MSKWIVHYLMYLEAIGFLRGEDEVPTIFISLDPRRCQN